MKSFFIVCDANGPISAKLEAETEEEAKAELKAMSAERLRAIIDDASTDLEDELGFSGEGMSDSQFAAKLEKKGASCVMSSNIVGEWEIWSVGE